MRRIGWIWLAAVLASPAIAHDDDHCECLGHHWASPVYLKEIRLQLAFIVGALAVMAIWRLISRVRRASRCG